jgi:hypothetical protein
MEKKKLDDERAVKAIKKLKSFSRTWKKHGIERKSCILLFGTALIDRCADIVCEEFNLHGSAKKQSVHKRRGSEKQPKVNGPRRKDGSASSRRARL